MDQIRQTNQSVPPKFSLYSYSVHTKFGVFDFDRRTYFYVPTVSFIEPPPGFRLTIADIQKQATAITNKNLKI